MRRVLRSLSTVLIVAGAVLLVDAVVTLVWQAPITALTTTIQQDELSGELEKLQATPPSPLELRALAGLGTTRRRVAFRGRALDRRLHGGQAAGRIVIPRIGANFVVVKGSAPGDLRKGPGLYDDTPFPGVPGTTAIAGHRTTYLAPFRHIDDLRAFCGDGSAIASYSGEHGIAVPIDTITFESIIITPGNVRIVGRTR